MHQLNRIELIGTIGSAHLTNIANDRVANFTVCTNYSYTDKNNGREVIDTTWHNVLTFESYKFVDFDAIKKGNKIHIIGRLASRPFVDSENNNITSFVVSAYIVESIRDFEIENGFYAEKENIKYKQSKIRNHD